MESLYRNAGLAAAAHSINQDLAAQSKMKIGEVIDHPDGYKVKVISGCYLAPSTGESQIIGPGNGYCRTAVSANVRAVTAGEQQAF